MIRADSRLFPSREDYSFSEPYQHLEDKLEHSCFYKSQDYLRK